MILQPNLALLSFEQDYLSATEDASLNYKLELNRVSATNVSFDWSVQHISTSAEDFTGALAGTQLIRAGDTIATISIDTSDDSAYEGDEIFSLNITNVTGAAPSSLAASGRIIDNDPQPNLALLSFEQDYLSATEDASLNYKLELNKVSATNVSFDWSVQHISTSAEDFTGALAGTQLIRAGDTIATISIDTSDDSAYETDEIFSLNITNVTGAAPSSLAASGRIIDNDPQPSLALLSFEQDYLSATEGASFTYKLELNKVSATNVSFDWSVQHISTSAEDFTGALAGTQLIRAGDTTITISIDTSDDSAYEGDENFSLNITNVTGAAPSSLAASGRIIDNDPQPSLALLSFEQVDATTTEGASFTYKLELNKASALDVSFDWSVQHISTSAEDFTGALAGTQLIRAGDTTITISIDTSDDSAYETDEIFSLNITNVTGAAPSSLAASGRIIDNDPQPNLALLSFEQDYLSATEDASLNYKLELNKVSATNVSFDWSVQHISTSAEDFTGALAGTQLIRAGDTIATISIDTSDDSIYETDEIFSLNITNVTGAAPSSLAASGRIIDNDPQPSLALLSFEQVDATTTEGASFTYKLELNKASATNVSFDWSVQHISTSAEDFTGALAGTQLIRAGDTIATISIDTSDDSAYEGDEIFSLNITNVTGAAPSSLAASGRIIDNDPQPNLALLSFEQDYLSATEDASLNYKLELNRVSATNVSFDWSVQHISTSAEDFTGALAGTQLIRAGDTIATISIDTSDDSIYETDEIFSLNITNVTGAAPSSLAASGRIIDNDPQPSLALLSFEQVDATTTEGASFTYKLELNKASATNVSFDWSVQHISTSAEDFTGALAGTQLIRAGDTIATISIDTSDDSAYETDEIFSLNITNVTGAAPSSLATSSAIIDNDPQPNLALLSFEQDYLSATEDASLNYKLELNRVSATNVSFDWSVQHISTSAEDFTGALAGTQLIRAGDTIATISIDTSDDSIYETDEIFSLNITNVTGAAPSSLAASGRIIDNDPQPNLALLSFEQDYLSATEDASLNYKLELNKASATNVSFDWSVQHISTSAEDFTGALAGTQLIRAGDTIATISIDTSDDSAYETDEIFSLNITNVTGAAPSSLAASGRIIDNDPQPSLALLSFEQVDATTTEGASFTYKLELNKASALDVSFDWSVQHISTSAEDFTGALAGTQLIRAGDTTITISIDTSDDSAYEGDENFSLNITNVTGAAPSSLATSSAIIDNDLQPNLALLSFEQDYLSATEDASLNYKLELNKVSATNVSFDWSVQHISTSAEDFTGALAGTQLIRAGDTIATISIDTSDDSIYETDEIFSLNITNVTGAAPSSLAASGRIIDNDPQPSLALLSFEQVDATTTEGASFTYKLELNKASATNVSFDWSVQHISTSAEDFTGALAGTQLIRAGDTIATISIDTSDDSAYEGDENFSLNITNVTGAAPSSLATSSAIIDNDLQPNLALLSFEQDYLSATEDASLNYKLELNRVSATNVSFDWSVQHISTSAEDFTGALAGTQLIRAGDTIATISIDTSDDSAYETDEIFSLNITNVTGAAPSSLAASGRIIDNDPQPSLALLSFEQVDATTTEGASFTYKLELNKASALDVSFDWSVQHISTSAEDFTGALAGTQLIRAGDTTITISIDTSDDSAYEGDENFSLNITNVTGAAPSSLATSSAIIDNDLQPNLALLSFEQDYLSATEDASLNYKLELNRVSATNVSFDWSVQHISTSAEDFTGALAGTQLIRAGDTIATISIDTSDDSAYETDEIFSLNITNVTGAAPSSLAASGRIIDNDPQPSLALLSFEQVDATTTEGASFTYKLELNKASALDVSFDWSVQHISTSAEDFTGALAGTQLIRAGDTTITISIDTSDDSAYETDEIFSLNITNVTGAAPSSLAASGRIIDNDPQPSLALLSFEQDYLSATEDASLNYKLELNKVSATNVSFDWSVQHISTSAEDFTGALAGTQLIRAGDTIATISIDTSDDSAYETDEIFSLNITNVTGAAPSSLAASGRIIDNDPQPSIALLSFEQDYSITAEGTSFNYRLQISKVSATDVSFDWSVQHISTSTSDFTGALAGSQRIAVGSTTVTISIDTSDDNIYETDEDFILNITKVTGATPSSLVARGRIVDNDAQLALSFEQVDSAVTEGISFNYRLQLNRASATNVSFDWSVQHSSTSTSDFTGALAGSQLIRAGDTTATIIIDTSDDNIYEGDESFTVNITNIRGSTSNSLSAGGSIIDNETQLLLSFEQSYNTALEGTSFNYRLQLNKESTVDVVFDWSIQHSSTSAADFTSALFGTQLIRAGDTSTTIIIDTSDDSIHEGDEIFTLNITKITGAAPSALAVGSNIIDNDAQLLLSFEQSYSIALEGTSLNYRLQLNKASAADVIFDWSVQHISTSTSDFTGALAGSQRIVAGSTTTTISIDTSDDNIYEGNEVFSLNITKVTGAIPNRLVASGNIIDNDAQLTLSFEQDYNIAVEGTSLNYRLQLNKESATDVSFDWSVQHSSTSTSDFTGALAGSQRIVAGSTTTTISIDTSDDSIYEGNEVFSLNITKVTGAVPNRLVASGNIIDNDAQLALSFEQDYLSATEDASLNYRLQLNRASATNVSFDWSVQHISTSAEDFTGAISGTQLIRAGDTSTTISIDTSDDNIYEGNEIFSLNITKITGAVPNRLVANGRIIDNDTQLVLSFEQSYNIAPEGTSLNYRLQLNTESATDVIFDWSVQHISTSTSDFTVALVGSQRIVAGSTTTTIIIDTSDDSAYEGNEVFSLNITNVTGAVPNRLVASGSIIDNDAQLTLSFEQDYNIAVEGTSLNYRLQLNTESATDVIFDWSVQHISTSTSDFTVALVSSQRIVAGSTTTTIIIDTSDDSAYEGNEVFSLNITNVTGAVPNRLVASGSIIDNDAQLTLSFEQDYNIAVEGTSLNYRLQLNRSSATDVSFDWSVQHSSTSTSDFMGALFGTKRIAAGDTSITISIDTSDDNIYEGNEIFSLNIIKITGAVPNRLVASGRIIDNDTQLVLSFEQVDSAVTEGTSLNYRLQLNKESATNVSFDWYVQHHLTSTSDFTGAIAGTQLIRAGSTTTTIIIDTSDDSIYEGNEIFSLNIIKITGAVPNSLAAGSAIIDNDAQLVLSFEQDYNSATEDASLNYRLQLNRASATDISFDWSVQHSSTSAEDFTGAISGTQLIRAGDTSTTISIDTSDDNIYEGDEDFILNITNVTGAIPDALAARGSIIDNDPQPSIAFEQVASIVLEGVNISYKLQLNQASAVNVSFDWSVQHSSTSTSDFTGATFGAKILFARDTTVTIELQINDDRIPELAEDFTLNITNIRGATPNSLSASITILENDIDATVDYNGNGLIDIVTQEHLDNIRYNLAGTSYKTSTNDAGTNCGGNICRGYELLANIALSTNWHPIGRQGNPFTSILQGNGYSIANLVIDGENNLGLFAALAGATIDNLVVEVVSITGDNYVGALAGRAEQSTISRVQIRAVNASSQLSARGHTVGGLLGYITNSNIIGVMSDLSIVGGNNDNADNVGGIVGYVLNSAISYATSSGSVFASGGADRVGGLAGSVLNNSTISHSSASGSVSSNGNKNEYYGGLVGNLIDSTTSHSSASGSVSSNGNENKYYGGLAGSVLNNSTISHSSASGSVICNGYDNKSYGGLAGHVDVNSRISYTSASGNVISEGIFNDYHGGLVGVVDNHSAVSYSSASASVSSIGYGNRQYGGLVGRMENNSTISYSSASGSVTSNGEDNNNYGGLVGDMIGNSKISYSSASGIVSGRSDSNNYGGLVGQLVAGTVMHSWSSSSVFAGTAAGLMGKSAGVLSFSYALGVAPYGLYATNTGSITNSYWNSETSGALEAASVIGRVINIASSNTAGMLVSTISGASVFAGFFDATDEHNRKIWTFTSGSYPVITELGIDEQAVALAYGLLRLASPYVGVSNLDSFLGGTLNNKDIELIANSYNANDTLAIVDVNLLQSNSAICAAGSTDTILTTTGANGATITLQKIAGSIEIEKRAGDSCEIIFSNQKTDGTLQLAAIISKGAASLTKKFEITLNTIQSIISLQPTTLSTREGDNLVFTLELNHRDRRNIAFDWSVQHSSTSTSDFTGARSGFEEISAGDTTATIELQINDDRIPELAEDFTLNITNIRGVTHNNLSASITILENDIDATVDYNGNGLIDIITEEHLDNIRYNLAGTSYKTSTSDAGKPCGGNICRGYELLANLDLSAFTNWQPIGSQNDPFTSILQGNGYSIANLVIDRGNNIGLFAALSGATIDNLVVEVVSINGNSDVGALAGGAITSTISRVHIRAANASSQLSARDHTVGGLLGYITNSNIIGVMSDLSIVGGNNDNADNVGGIVGYVLNSAISYATSSGSVFASGGVDRVGGLAGSVLNNSTISHSSASGSVSSNGNENEYYGGLVGNLIDSTTSHSSASGSVSSNGNENEHYGGLVGYMDNNSTISSSSASGSVSSNGNENKYYGGLAGHILNNSTISYSSASGSVISNGYDNKSYGGLVGYVDVNSRISYTSASGNVISDGILNNYYGGLVGVVDNHSAVSYSSASGSVISNINFVSNYYGGLVGVAFGEVRHSWSSSSVFASSAAGLVGLNSIKIGFSYALGVASYGLVTANSEIITNSYWNSETSGALKATDATDNIINIASSDTAGMLASTGSAEARIFKGFADATDEHNRNIWTFARDSYPVITELGVDKQAVALAYGLLRLASPNVGASTLDSFVGGTLNNEDITLDSIDYDSDNILAILDLNLLESNTDQLGNNNICRVENNSLVSNSINFTKVKLIVNLAKTSNNLYGQIIYQDCNIVLDSGTFIQTGDRLQLDAIITKGSASMIKKFVIDFL